VKPSKISPQGSGKLWTKTPSGKNSCAPASFIGLFFLWLTNCIYPVLLGIAAEPGSFS